MSKFLNLKPIKPTHGPWTMKDTQGFQVAIEMLKTSQEKGRNVSGYVQYDTIQRLQSSYGIVFDTIPDSVLDPIIFKNERGIPFQC